MVEELNYLEKLEAAYKEAPEKTEAEKQEEARLADEAKLKSEQEAAEAKAKLEAETKTETTTETEVEKESVLSLLDNLTTPAAEGSKEPVKAEFSPEQLKQLADAEAILGNPVAKAIAEATPEQVKQIAKELAGTDYTKTSYAELLAMKAEKLGLSGDEINEAVEEAMVEFDALGKIGKKERETALREEFKSTQSESPLLKQLMEQQANKPAAEKPLTQAEIDVVIKKETSQIEDTGKSMIGKDYFGAEISQAEIDAVKAKYDVNEASKFVDAKTGAFNEKAFIKSVLPDVMIQKVYEAGLKAGELKANKKNGNTNREIGGGSPIVGEVNADKQALESFGFNTSIPKSVQYKGD
jgi:hypothetical protein